MSTTTTMSSSCSYQLDKLHLNTRRMVRSRSSVHQTSCGIPSISSTKHGYCDAMRQQLYSSTINRRGQAKRTIIRSMDLNALNNLPPVPIPCSDLNALNNLPPFPIPSGSPFPSWSSSWMLLTTVPMILPWPLIVIKNKMDTALQNVVIMAEGIEEVARRVDRLADEITEMLPDGDLKNAILKIDAVAEDTIKKADWVEELVDKVLKVKKVENKLQSIIEAAVKDKVLAKNTSPSSKIPVQEAKVDGGDASISA